MGNAPAGTDRQERVLGVVLFVLGAIATWFQVCVPLAAMQAGAAEVEFRFIRVLIGPLLLGLGLIQVALGARAPVLLGRSAPANWRTALVVVLLFAAGIAVYAWLRVQAATLGYGA